MFGLKAGKWRFECLECRFKTESHSHFIEHAFEHYEKLKQPATLVFQTR